MKPSNKNIIHTKKNIPPKGKRNNDSGSGYNWARLIYWFLLSVFFVFIVYIFLFSGYLSLTIINQKGARLVSNEEILFFINYRLSKKYLNVIPAKNYFFVSAGNTEREIREHFKMIETAKVKKIFPDRMDIDIIEKQISFVICKKNECFAIDEKGKTIANLNEIIGQTIGLDPILLLDESPNDIPVQGELFNEDEVDFIRKIGSSIENEIGLGLEKSLKTPSLISHEYRAKTSEGWEIYLNSNLGVEKEVDMLKVVLKEKISDDDRKKLEYIDLRTDNKVYYRLKKEENIDEGEDNKKEENVDKEDDRNE
jgi:cell division septal protein FtsQ